MGTGKDVETYVSQMTDKISDLYTAVKLNNDKIARGAALQGLYISYIIYHISQITCIHLYVVHHISYVPYHAKHNNDKIARGAALQGLYISYITYHISHLYIYI